jgi:hypothetical protein
MIPGGILHDVQALARHQYYAGQKANDNSQLPLAFMGICSVALGCSMLWSAYQKHGKFVEGLRQAGRQGGRPLPPR